MQPNFLSEQKTLTGIPIDNIALLGEFYVQIHIESGPLRYRYLDTLILQSQNTKPLLPTLLQNAAHHYY